MYAKIVTSSRQAGIGNGLTYKVSGFRCQVGQLVKVPLRKKLVEGIVVELSEERPEGNFDVKEIAEVLSEASLLSEEQIALARWIADYYCCTLRQALTVFLPGMPWSKLLPNEQRIKNQELRIKSHTKDCIPHSKFFILHSPTLTPRQTAAYKVIKSDPRPTLLFGVTGSGKTEIYASLIRNALEEGKSAILLLPEILLTENFTERFERLVSKERMGVVHSRITLAKRRDVWRRCRSGELSFLLGSRSALFYPLRNLSLVIIDEEHEWTYKNEQSPRYHAGKVAEQLCRMCMPRYTQPCHPECSEAAKPRSVSRDQTRLGTRHDIPKLVLGSATPSVESWHRAKEGQYQLVELPERYGNAQLPEVQIIDLGEVRFGKHYPFSPALLEAIRKRLEKKEQCILFLNRRGFATTLLCMSCRYRFEDPETKLPYTVHRVRHAYLLSHHTGEELPLPDKCPKCGSPSLLELGAGTQRIEVILQELFPDARILRADADILKSPEEMRSVLAKMKEGEADILFGTQSVVKGLDLPGVTLAAVLLADIGLSLPHFRAGERIFQLLTQLAGRSGRRDPGEVIIQTFRPQALEISLAAKHDVRTYLEQELVTRVQAHYPPSTDLVRFVFSAPGAESKSNTFCEMLKKFPITYNLEPETFHVSRSPSLFSGGKVWQVLLRGKNVQEVLKNLPEFDGIVDVDPVECL